MSIALDNFRNDFLYASSWETRKDGPPLYLLDKLDATELAVAEMELISHLSKDDFWPVSALGYIRSQNALPSLYNLLYRASSYGKVITAHAIFNICKDEQMIDIVEREIKNQWNSTHLIDIIYTLPDFDNERTNKILHDLREHEEYLVAYNATRALQLPTEEIVERFRQKKIAANKISQNSPERNKLSWWQKIFS
ncbi:hypothetical protein [Pollutibacter soli]|uniref:hypothetical protein n=1 Tax=Pollutibacter soli TaxID=3034157 RepID=UPI003013C0D0